MSRIENLCMVDIDQDSDLDIVVGGKSGLCLFENMIKGQEVAALTDVYRRSGALT